jgi:purine nucleoside phosphorylase
LKTQHFSWDDEHFELLKKLAKENDIKLFEGDYCWTNGPSFETPSEVRMGQICGGSCVGMSTVPEVLVAKAGGLQTFGISIITNLGAGLHKSKLTHEEVMEMGKNGSADFQKLLKLFLENVKIPEGEPKLTLNSLSHKDIEKPFPYKEMASSVKIAAGTVIKKLKNTSDTAILIDKHHEKLLDSLSNQVSIDFTDIPHFPFKKKETENDKIVTGLKEGKQIYFIVCEKLVGYTIEEATFLSIVLYELGIKFVISTINCSPVTQESKPKGNVVFLKDFMNFTYSSRPFKFLYPICDPHPSISSEPLFPER